MARRFKSKELVGGIRALTTLSPVKRLPALRRRLFVVSTGPGLGRPLLNLSFIHYARWSVLSELPHPNGSGDPYSLNWPYLLFEANYDGPEDEYLNTFADVLPLRLTKLFGTCVGFREQVERAPGADGRPIAPAAFREFVDKNKLTILDFRPHDEWHSVDDVRQAIAIAHTERRSDRLSGWALDRARDKVESMALGPPARGPGVRDAIVAPLYRRVRRDYGVNPLTIVAPLKPGERDRLVARFDYGKVSLLGAIPDSHFARLALIPPTLQDLGQPHPDLLPVPYLLFTADHDGDTDDYIEAIRTKMTASADAIFGHCAEYPGSGLKLDFRDWFRRHRVKTDYYVAGYPPVALEDLKEMLDVRAGIARGRLEARA